MLSLQIRATVLTLKSISRGDDWQGMASGA
jgi:hypothetical protein